MMDCAHAVLRSEKTKKGFFCENKSIYSEPGKLMNTWEGTTAYVN